MPNQAYIFILPLVNKPLQINFINKPYKVNKPNKSSYSKMLFVYKQFNVIVKFCSIDISLVKAGGNTASDLVTQSLTSLTGSHVPKKRFFCSYFRAVLFLLTQGENRSFSQLKAFISA